MYSHLAQPTHNNINSDGRLHIHSAVQCSPAVKPNSPHSLVYICMYSNFPSNILFIMMNINIIINLFQLIEIGNHKKQFGKKKNFIFSFIHTHTHISFSWCFLILFNSIQFNNVHVLILPLQLQASSPPSLSSCTGGGNTGVILNLGGKLYLISAKWRERRIKSLIIIIEYFLWK